jgi:hypothetical protein
LATVGEQRGQATLPVKRSSSNPLSPKARLGRADAYQRRSLTRSNRAKVTRESAHDGLPRAKSLISRD